MVDRAAEPPLEAGTWAASLSQRLSPYVDPAIGLLAAVMSVLSLLSTDMASLDPRLEPPSALSVTATAVAGLSLGWRRTKPAVSFAVFTLGCLLVTLTEHYIGLLSILLLFSLYSLAVHGGRRAGVIGLVASIVVFNVLALLDVPDLRTSDLLQAFALLVVAWALGDAVRSRRAHQAEQLQVAEQEAAVAREQAELAVTEERLRIARELHDVVAHSMSLIAVQAGVGGHVIRTDVEAAERALDIISETSRKALTQTRSMLGLLRDEGTGPTTSPVMSIGDLGALVADLQHAGVDAELTVDGTPRALEPAVELTAYRVAQESLTNVLRHSGARRATIRVGYGDNTLDIDVRDPGRGSRPRPVVPLESSGHGLLGLRERTRLLGGVLEYGPYAGGFRVWAHLPAPSPGPS